jgi:sigma-B regulation protein RsbQ
MNVLKRNNVRIFGSGEPMVFLHGFGCDQLMWRFLAPIYEKTRRVVLLDFVGHGGSDLSAYNPERYSTLAGYAADAAEVLHALDLRGAVLVGHSVGSMIALLASFQEPERVSRLVFICPSPCYLNDPPDYHGGFERKDLEGLIDLMNRNYMLWANQFASAVVADPKKIEFRREFVGGLCSLDPSVAKNFARATFFADNRADLPKARVPSLILQCDPDSIAPPVVGRYIAEHMPRSTYKLLATPGHSPHMTAPDLTAAAIDEYLRAPA